MSSECADIATQFIELAGLADIVKVVRGAAEETLRKLKPEEKVKGFWIIRRSCIFLIFAFVWSWGCWERMPLLLQIMLLDRGRLSIESLSGRFRELRVRE
jgi:hypothetical protein